MNQCALDFAHNQSMGTDLGHAAAQVASDHADRVTPAWSDRALAALRAYCATHVDVMAEDVRAYAATLGVPQPPDRRAWGAVMLRAKAAGWIKHAGFTRAKDPRVHSNPVGTWKSLIAERPAA